MEILNDPSRQSQFSNLNSENPNFVFVKHRRCVSVPATEGSVSFTLNMSPEFSPALQVVAYAVLPSEHVIAHKADLAVTKCFLNKVGWRRSQTCVRRRRQPRSQPPPSALRARCRWSFPPPPPSLERKPA